MAPFQQLAVRSCARAVRLYIISSMQLAGFSCCFCHRSVVLYSYATGFSGCKSVAHKTCLSLAGQLCPQYTTSWRNFVDGIACSQRCPSCGVHFSPSQVRYCIKCGTQTSWDTREEYLAARVRIRRLGVGSAVRTWNRKFAGQYAVYGREHIDCVELASHVSSRRVRNGHTLHAGSHSRLRLLSRDRSYVIPGRLPQIPRSGNNVTVLLG